jgi:tetratricopeptide (TPR) repeat protein
MANAHQPGKREKKENPPVSAKGKNSFRWNYCLIAFALPFILYALSIKNDYNLDDDLVTQNQHLTSQGISAIPEIFTSNYYSDNMGYSYEYRPVVLTSFAIEHQLFGDNPYVSHFINVLLYSFLCFLLYRCLRRFFKNTNYLFPLIITLLFAFHPLHTEVVCSIKNRDELFSMIFGLFAFRYAMLFADKKSLKDLFLMAVLFVLGMLSKKSVLIFGAVIPVFLLVYGGEILSAVIVSVILFVGSALVNPLMVMHHGTVLLLATALSLILYLLLGLKTSDSRRALLAPLIKLVNIIAANTDNSAKEDIELTVKNTAAKENYLLWVLSLLNIASFGTLLYYSVFSMVPAIIAIFLFVTVQSRKMQLVNLMAFAVINGLVIFRFYDPFIYLLAISIMGLLYYYDIHNMRKLILLFSVIILISAYPKIGKMVPGIIFLALFVLHSKYSNKWIKILYSTLLFLLVRKLLFNHYDFQFINAGNWVYKIRFLFFALLFVFLLLHKRMRLFNASAFILIFSLGLLLKTDGLPEGDKLKSSEAVNKMPAIEPLNNSRPLTFIEDPVNMKSPTSIRLGTSALIGLKYLKKIFMPWPLSFYYGYKCIEPTDIFSIGALGGIAVYILLILLAFATLDKSKGLFTGIAMFVIGIIAVSNFFYPLPGMIADRFLFIPSLGFAMAIVSGLSLLFKVDWVNLSMTPKGLPTALRYVLIVILVVYAGLTVARTADWKDKLTLFRHDIKNTDESCQAHNLLAGNLVIYSFGVQNVDSQRMLRNEALVHFKKALSIYGGYMNIPYDMGRTYMLLNEPDSALIYFKIAHDVMDSLPDDNMNIGKILMSKGLFAEAIPYFKQVIKYQPDNQYPYGQIGIAFFSMKRYRESLDITEQCIHQFPNAPTSYINAGKIFETMGTFDSALVYYRKAYALSNGNMQLKQTIEGLEKKR